MNDTIVRLEIATSDGKLWKQEMSMSNAMRWKNRYINTGFNTNKPGEWNGGEDVVGYATDCTDVTYNKYNTICVSIHRVQEVA